MKIEEIQEKIASKSVTEKDFNVFIETIAKSANERVVRRSRLTKQNERNENPETRAKTITRTGNTNPLKTGRGRTAVKKRGIINKQNASKFSEAIEFINTNKNKQLSECVGELQRVDKSKLNSLVKRLLAEPGELNRDWLYGIHRMIEDGK